MSKHSIENVSAPSRPPATDIAAKRGPAPAQGASSVDGRYDALIVQSYRVPAKFNLLAIFFLWVLLAGFVVFPATFPSLLRSTAVSSSSSGRLVQRAIQSVPLLVLGIVCFVLGTAGIAWLWRTRRREYLWLMDRLFLPGCLNTLAGLIAAVANVYTARGGHWSRPAVAVSALMAACVLVFATLYAAYSFVVLPQGMQIAEHTRREDVRSKQTA